MAEEIAARITAITEGELTIKVFAAGELVPAHGEFDAVSQGAADMYHAAEYYWQGKSKGFPFFAAVPFGMTAIEALAWMEYGNGNKLWNDLSTKFNLIAMAAGSTGTQMGGWFKKEILSMDDFRGLVMRIPGLGGDVIKAVGGVPKLLSGGEIYQALQSGAIDAAEWVGPWNDLAFGFYQEAEYYYCPGFQEPGPIMSLGVNLDVWNSLSPTHQKVFRAVCNAANAKSLAQFDWENQKALKTLVNDHGVKIRTYPDDVWIGLKMAAHQVLEQIGNETTETKAIYNSYIQALADAEQYAQRGEAGYLRARVL